LLAVGIWAWRFLPGTAPTESDLRQTAGVSAEVVSSRATPQGVEVTCRVSNTTGRVAAQVVLRVALLDANGQTLAANPLAGVADLAAGQPRETLVLVPFHGPHAGVKAGVEVSLVRWRE
jgi:hypothetical protein